MQSNRQSYRTKWLGVTYYQPLTEVPRCQHQNWMRWSVLTVFLSEKGGQPILQVSVRLTPL